MNHDLNHDQVAHLLDAYLDGELDLTTCVDLEEHIAGCEACRKKMAAGQELIDTIRSETPRFEASPFLETRIRAALRAQEGPPAPFWKRISVAWISSGTAVVALILLGAYFFRTPGLPSIIQEAVADHIRSLQVSHIMDVASTDQHTVKPWFAGKLDYSPPVIDLAPSGYPLIGGRLDVLDGRTVAAIIYQRRRHDINLFIWPSDTHDLPGHFYIQHGYHILGWSKSGMNYLAISDLAEKEFRDFVKMIQDQTVEARPVE